MNIDRYSWGLEKRTRRSRNSLQTNCVSLSVHVVRGDLEYRPCAWYSAHSCVVRKPDADDLRTEIRIQTKAYTALWHCTYRQPRVAVQIRLFCFTSCPASETGNAANPLHGYQLNTKTQRMAGSLLGFYVGRGGRDRTCDPSLPKRVRYRCATPRLCRIFRIRNKTTCLL